MVAAIGLLIPASLGSTLTVFGIPLVTAGGLTMAGTLVNVAGSLLLSAAAQALQPKPDRPRPENIQLNIRQSVGPRLRHYGRVRAGGTVVFFRAREGKFYRVVVHGHGEIDGIEAIYLNRAQVAIDAAGWVTTPQYVVGGRSRVRLLGRAGQVPQAAFAEIGAIWPAWDAGHRLDGLWASLTIAEQVPPDRFRQTYPASEPAIELVARTARVHDPRSGATVYSENAALIMADYIASPDGFNRPGAVDDTWLRLAADDCDALVSLASGGSEPKWRICGTHSLQERPDAVLRRMLDATGADVRLMPTGKIAIEMPRWREPEVTLTDADIIEIEMLTAGPSIVERFNTLPFTYVDPALAHTEVEGEAWHDAARAAADGGELTGELTDMSFAPSHRQARTAARILTARRNPLRQIRARFRPRAILAMHEPVVRLTVAAVGFDAVCRVQSYAMDMASGMVTLDLAETVAGDYLWTTADEGTPQAMPEPDVGTGLPAPVNFTAAPQGVQSAQNAWSAGIVAVWDAPMSDALTPRLRISPAGQDKWQIVTVAADAVSAAISGLSDGAAYDLDLRFVTTDAAEGPPVTEAAILAGAATAPPSAPTALAVAYMGGGVARVSFTTSADPAIWKTEIRRDGALVASVYSNPAQSLAVDDSCGTGTFDWTARSINVSGMASISDAGPVTATII